MVPEAVISELGAVFNNVKTSLFIFRDDHGDAKGRFGEGDEYSRCARAFFSISARCPYGSVHGIMDIVPPSLLGFWRLAFSAQLTWSYP